MKGGEKMKYTKQFLGSFLATIALFAVVLSPVAADSTVVVSGDTSAGENQPGWMFNRDTTTDTPFEFNNAQKSIGEGSLYVKPIGPTGPDKFIAENFINTPIANVNSLSYDFRIGSGGVDSEEEQFYMNVYANFGSSDDLKFYDCRYDVVPTIGSTGGFTTVTFDPNQAYLVTTRNTSPHTCPTIPAQMDNLSAGSNIRAFAINVGDTSTSDEGLDGYLDKVVVDTDTGITTYDFEAATVPSIVSPAHNATITTSALTEVDWTNSTGSAPVQYQYEAFSDAGYTSSVYQSGWLNESEIATAGTPVGTYYLRVRARNGNEAVSAWSNGASNPHKITVTADTTPTVTITPTITPTVTPPATPTACTGMSFANTIVGTADSEKIIGTSGNDLIFAMGGSDKVEGRGGEDCIVGGDGSDKLLGGAGADVILGGNDSDSLEGDNGADKLYGDNGSDSLRGGDGNDILSGGEGSDSLRGDDNNDTLNGDAGDDSARGGDGNDTCTAESERQCEI